MKRTSAGAGLVILVLFLDQACHGCGRPPLPPEIPCIGYIGGSLVLQLGTIFQTNTTSQCSAGIGLVGPPSGLSFSGAMIGVQNTLTNVFTSVFSLNPNNAAGAAWANGSPGPIPTAGQDINGTQPLPGATWFGFSNLNVPPVFPPLLGLNEIYAISFTTQGIFNPTDLQGLRAQYGSGGATGSGLPDFNHVADLSHSAQYSAVTFVPEQGTSNWIPEPSSYVTYLVFALAFSACSIGARRLKQRMPAR